MQSNQTSVAPELTDSEDDALETIKVGDDKAAVNQ